MFAAVNYVEMTILDLWSGLGLFITLNINLPKYLEVLLFYMALLFVSFFFFLNPIEFTCFSFKIFIL